MSPEAIPDKFKRISGGMDPEKAMALLRNIQSGAKDFPEDEEEVVEALPIEEIDLDKQKTEKGLTPRAQEAADASVSMLNDMPDAEFAAAKAQEKSIVSQKLEGLREKVRSMTAPKETAVQPAEKDGDESVSQALSTLPEHEQKELKGIDPKLVDSISTGPSSLIDQDVVANLEKLPKEQQLKFWEMVISPREAVAMLNAKLSENKAKATIRSEIAKTSLSTAEFAAQDLNSKVFRSFIDQLRSTYDLATFCDEHGIQMPQQGTLQEAHILMQNHFAWLAQAKRSTEIKKQLDIYIARKTALQGQIATERMRAEMLPQLRAANLQKDANMAAANAEHLPAVIAAREAEFPLQRKAMQQKAAHGVGMVTGTITAGVTGGVVYAIGGVIVGGKEAIDWTGQQLAIAGEKAAQGWERTKEKISQMRAGRGKRSR